ncbi:MAG: hypothetical protein ACRDVP_10080 [Acidimicrobiales bacterium]
MIQIPESEASEDQGPSLRFGGHLRGAVPTVIALGFTLALSISAIARTAKPVEPVLILGLVGIGFLLLSWRFPPALGASLAALIAQYAVLVALRKGGAVDAWAPLEVAGFVAVGELAAWGGQVQRSVPLARDARLGWIRGLVVAGTCVGALAIGAMILAVVGGTGSSSAIWEIVGGAAAIGAVTVAFFVRKAALPEPS